jgi:hypothetical protein
MYKINIFYSDKEGYPHYPKTIELDDSNYDMLIDSYAMHREEQIKKLGRYVRLDFDIISPDLPMSLARSILNYIDSK